MSGRLRIGTRGSPLARAQAEEVQARLHALHRDLRLDVIVIRTEGDEAYRSDLGSPLDGKRAFTKRIEDALLGGHIDLAVHSLKDLPTEPVDGLVLAAIPERADPRDAIVTRGGGSLDDLAPRSRLGTSSLRRRAQILARRPDFEVLELHGNVGTRLQRLEAHEMDAVVVAAAGLDRLRVSDLRTERLDPNVVTPAAGQGALAVQARASDAQVLELLWEIDHGSSRTEVEAERALSARLGGGCNMPFGALATTTNGAMTLRAVVASPDGRRISRAFVEGSAGDSKTVTAAERQLIDHGAREILREGPR